jgi:hypothetical protein
MRIIIVSIGFLLLLMGCKEKQNTDPLTHWSREKQKEVALKIVRYSDKLAPRASHITKFNKEFDPYYKRVAEDYVFMWIKPEEDGSYYFFFSRPAKSITPMFEGIAGQLKLNDTDSLVVYNEIFRTWKMSDKDLRERGKMLFDRMAAKRDLSIFYPKASGDKYIEFPDGRFSFDIELRRWRDNILCDSTLAR